MMTQKTEDLKLASYDYDLPKESIANRPVIPRHNSRLLIYKVQSELVIHDRFINLAHHLSKDTALVLNETKVYPCRLIGVKKTGGKCELFLLSPHPIHNTYRALIRAARKKKIGDEFIFGNSLEAKIDDIYEDGTFGIKFIGERVQERLENLALVPIPPYVRGGCSDERDKDDYQTLFARNTGSVAAPTAGLHFTPQVFENLEKAKIAKSFVTLHVGMGTFAPVKSENIIDHHMHSERYTVSRDNYTKIVNYKKKIAVGTTTLRVLESMASQKCFKPDQYYETDIFLYPGKKISTVTGLITNFHLPQSSLLMLVSALIGRNKTLELYEIAKQQGYRFYSYGDAMLILMEE